MQTNLYRSSRSDFRHSSEKGRCPWAVLGVTIGIVLAAQFGYAPTLAGQSSPRPTSPLVLQVDRLPDADYVRQIQEENTRRRNFAAANAERLREMNKASDLLVTLAMALDAEIQNPSGGPSANTIQKAEAIEKLARAVKEKMKLTVPSN